VLQDHERHCRAIYVQVLPRASFGTNEEDAQRFEKVRHLIVHFNTLRETSIAIVEALSTLLEDKYRLDKNFSQIVRMGNNHLQKYDQIGKILYEEENANS
jgi:hypothetical protein